MRILWLSPGLRATARIRTESLKALGAEVMLYTADLHYESDEAREYETVLLGRPNPTTDWVPCLNAYQAAQRFRPDVVVTELLRDPRWRMFAHMAPRIRLVHDHAPHDDQGRDPWWNRLFFERWDERADGTVVFSHYVAEGMRKVGRTNSPIYVAPLHSDLDPTLVCDPLPADQRKDFVMVGRQNPYKNHDVVFSAWEAHVQGADWRGDELVLFGGGDIPRALPAHARWERGDFKYKDVVGQIARAKGSIVHYTEGASQSGVQVLSMQLGVPTLVSTGGALPEYQPPGLSVTGINDVSGLAQGIDVLADPAEVARQSNIARERYLAQYSASSFAQRFLEIAEDVVDNA